MLKAPFRYFSRKMSLRNYLIMQVWKAGESVKRTLKRHCMECWESGFDEKNVHFIFWITLWFLDQENEMLRRRNWRKRSLFFCLPTSIRCLAVIFSFNIKNKPSSMNASINYGRVVLFIMKHHLGAVRQLLEYCSVNKVEFRIGRTQRKPRVWRSLPGQKSTWFRIFLFRNLRYFQKCSLGL